MNRIKASFIILCVFAITALLISGCATKPVRPNSPHQFTKVDSIAIAGADLKNKTYVLTSAIKDVSDDDIQFKEVARYVENALSKTGYKRLASEKADLIIRLAYGIGVPKTETATKTYTTSGGYSYPVGWVWIHVPPKTETVTTKSTTYERFLMLEAYDSKDRRSQLWRTTLKSKGWDPDLRAVLPRMIAAAIDKFGTDTRGEVNAVVPYHHPCVLDIIRSPDANKEVLFTEEERLGVKLESMDHGNQFWYQDKMAGVLVVGVVENSAAQKMGVQKYDVILAVNNKIADQPEIVLEEIKNTRTDGIIRLTFFSWNKYQDVSVKANLE